MQSYLLPIAEYDTDKLMVMIAQKKLEGSFITIDGTKQQQNVIWNYAGQWVIPGGKGLNGERPESAGLREFKEETGVAMAIQFEDATITTTEFTDSHNRRFSCTYVILAHEENDALAGLINNNINAGFNGPIADDELAHVEWFRIQDAADKLTTRIIVANQYQERAYQPTDWWNIMIDGARQAIEQDRRIVV